ncbi:hypothetical protein D3C75_821270 [compost metagenome]
MRLGGLVIHFNQNVRRLALLGQVRDFFLIGRLQVFVIDADLIEEGSLLQLEVIDDHLIRRHEFLGVLVVVGLDLIVGQLHRCRVGLDVQRGEIAGLFFQTGKRQYLCIGHETATGETGTQLTNQHFLSQHLAELHAGIAELANHLVETLGAELAIHLKLRRLQDDLIQSRFGKGEFRVFCALQQQFAIDQALESRLAQHFFIEQGSIEILAQLLHELTALHIDRLAQFVLADFFAIDLRRFIRVRRGLKNGVETGQSHQCNDDPDNSLGNPAL